MQRGRERGTGATALTGRWERCQKPWHLHHERSVNSLERKNARLSVAYQFLFLNMYLRSLRTTSASTMHISRIWWCWGTVDRSTSDLVSPEPSNGQRRRRYLLQHRQRFSASAIEHEPTLYQHPHGRMTVTSRRTNDAHHLVRVDRR